MKHLPMIVLIFLLALVGCGNRGARMYTVGELQTTTQNAGLLPGSLAEDVNITVVTPPRYNSVGRIRTGEGGYLGMASVGGMGSRTSAFINLETGNEITPFNIQNTWSFSEGLLAVRIDDNWGFVDAEGNWVIPPIHSFAWSFCGGLARVQNADGLWGFIDKQGQYAIPPIPQSIQSVRSFGEGLAAVGNTDRLWGYIDMQGQQVIPFYFNYAPDFSNGVATPRRSNMQYLIDRYGNNIVQPFRGSLSQLENGLILMGEWGQVRGAVFPPIGVIDREGNEILPRVYDSVSYIGDGQLLVGTGSREKGRGYDSLVVFNIESREFTEYPNNYIREITPTGFDRVSSFSNGAVVHHNGEIGVINTNNEWIVPLGIYTRIESFRSELVTAVSVGDNTNPESIRWGFIDIEGNEIVPPIFRSVEMDTQHSIFRDGLARVQCAETELWGMVDAAGQEAVPFAFDYIRPFEREFTLANTGGRNLTTRKGHNVTVGGTWHIVNRQGCILASFEYATMDFISDTLIAFAEEVTYLNYGQVIDCFPTGLQGIIALHVDDIG